MRVGLLRSWLLAASCAFLLAACATPPRTPVAPGTQVWTGRLALTVEGQREQSFSAGFELTGAPQQGELKLSNPLGGTVAVLAWAPGSAVLRSGGKTQQFDSLEALAQEATGAPIPIAALFDWLAGKATPVAGWQADVSQVAEGRLRARRVDPPPAADLRLAFDH
ncbi:MAG TPA: outer membrane lipoprotein LolB [Ramlibacter sp.]|uniref:outer membrane lipoprotein LolB n=1 Tax=Ramlibacter sp. TaxID=1917967 RepID=UPI002D80899B|nr:outer membrane lipoprotein LolB [Ramlibacter sp.]HET8747612.1 outer membrane lipoprotein LolB [Ramlibacter sp.]